MIRMRTIGMVKINTKPAPNKVLLDSLTAATNSLTRMRCKKNVSNETTHNRPPGK
ncbi:hypothetical protein D3C79_1115620 [compost metagenome]